MFHLDKEYQRLHLQYSNILCYKVVQLFHQEDI